MSEVVNRYIRNIQPQKYSDIKVGDTITLLKQIEMKNHDNKNLEIDKQYKVINVISHKGHMCDDCIHNGINIIIECNKDSENNASRVCSYILGNKYGVEYK